MSNKKPTHVIVYKTGEFEQDNQKRDVTVQIGAGWETPGGAINLKVDVPVMLDGNVKLLPLKQSDSE